MHSVRRVLAVAAVGAALAGCGGDDAAAPAAPSLSPAGQAGWQVMRDSGCAACHGSDGEGAVGPAFVGLYGSEVPLQDGSTVVADDAYLRRSIEDPGADRVEGYNVPMPENDLSEAEIDAIIGYLREIGAEA